MPRFAYEALAGSGRTVQGVEEAATAREAERALRDRGLRPVDLDAGGDAVPGERGRTGRRGRSEDLTEAVRCLATLLDAGFPLDQALGTAADLAARDDVGDAVERVRGRVRSGDPLSDALAAEDDLLPALAVGMTRAGERGGDLAGALGRLADHLEREARLRHRVVSALVYPAMMAVVGGAALAVLVLYVLPKFVGLLEEAGAALPRSTAFLLGAVDVLGRWWLPLTLALLLVGGAAAAWVRTDRGRALLSAAALRAPVVGPLRRRIVAVRLGRSLSRLLEAGLPVVPALQASAASLGDPAAAAEIEAARRRVRTGRSLADALASGRALPPLFLRMTALGEEGGRLPELLGRAADTAEEQLERRLERLVRLVEPALVVLFGLAVGFVALSLLQAVYGVRLQAF